MNPETKALLKSALVLSGYSSLNSFITNSAVTEAKKIIKREMTISLTQVAGAKFLDELGRPRNRNPKFLTAVRRYKEAIEGDMGGATT